ncbi:hypothetical protein QYF61_003832 [Mycteria americana]|uniref:Uncharacterized protein n=1 Tax=Mycteria americana TaxID=33587 RepID=A0AAN7N4U2_MYCAM|nr:hypothetical protein QYF61_003832 [Mycteria americana]
MQDLALGLVDLHEVCTGPPLQPVRVPLDGIPSLQRVDRTTQLGVVGKLAEVSGNFTGLPQLLEYDGQWLSNFIRQFPRDLWMHLIRSRGYLSLLPPSVGFLFVFEFVQEHLVHSCRPPDGFLPGYSTKQMPEEAKACSPDVQGSELAVRPPRCPKDLVLHHFMVTAAKAALELHIPHRRLLVGENKVQHSTSPCWLLSPWEKEVIISAFEEPPGLLMPCCVVPPRDIGVVEVPHEEEGLDGDSTTSLGSLFQCLTTLLVKKFFLISNLNLPWRNLRPFSLVLSLVTWEKRPTPTSLQPPFRLNNPSSLSCDSSDLCCRPFTSFIALLWTRSSTSVSLL